MHDALKKKKIQKGILTVAVILLVASLICVILMSSGTYAKYITSGNASDNARVASFNVNAEEGKNNLSILLNEEDGTDSDDYTLTLTNDSEVAAKCTVTVTITEDNVDANEVFDWSDNILSLKLYPTDENGNKKEDEVVTGEMEGEKAVFTDVAIFDVGSSSQQFILEFSYPRDEVTAEEIKATFEFTVSADFEQID